MADRLTKDHLKIVRNALYKAASKWYDVGLELDISPDDLNTIKKANSDNPPDCLREMLTHWLSRVDPEPSWNDIIFALYNPAVNYPALAEEIKQEYCSIDLGESHTEPVIRRSATRQETRGSYLATVTNLKSYAVKELLPKPTRIPTLHSRYWSKSVNRWKGMLIQSLESIACTQSSMIVSKDQVQKAKQCIKYGGASNERYHLIDFDKLLNENKVSSSTLL